MPWVIVDQGAAIPNFKSAELQRIIVKPAADEQPVSR
jgi:hypothetical protein